MKKWIVTGLAVVALGAAGLYARSWLPVALPWLRNADNANLLQALANGGQLVLWIAAGFIFVAGLWRRRGKRATPSTSAASAAAGTMQSGGVNAAGASISARNVMGQDLVSTTVIIQRQAERDSALHQLPPPPADFTGRAKDLDELLQAVKTGGVTISGLQGLGGVGKTALALKLADLLKQDYPDAQIYLNLLGVSEDPITATAARQHALRSWNPTAQLPDEEAQLGAAYHSQLDGKRVLLLMDNARDAAQVEPLIPPKPCLLLVTSRLHFTLPGLLVKNLDVLSMQDALELLQRVAPRLEKEKPEQLGELVRLCGYFPLAIRAVGSALQAKKNITTQDYIQRLQDAGSRLRLTETEAALQSSYDLLSEDLQQRFRCLAVFPETFDQAAATAVWDTKPESAQDTLAELITYSLVDFNEERRLYRLHDLVRLFAGQRWDRKEKDQAEERHARHYIRVLSNANALYLKGGKSVMQGLALFDAEWSNIQAGQTWALGHATQSQAAAEHCWQYPDAGADVLYLRRHPRERVAWIEAALFAARRLKERSAEGRALSNLGLAYSHLGEYRRAIEYHEKNIKISHEVGDRRGYGAALGNLGNAYYDLGKYHRAIEYHEKSLKILQEVKDQRGEGAAWGNLGNAYYALGEYPRAIEYHEKNIKISREVGDRRGYGAALSNLGRVYCALGEYPRAIECYEEQWQIAHEIVDPRGTSKAQGGLGNAYYGLGEHSRALEFHEQRLKTARDIGHRQGEGSALFDSALALCQLGDRSGAIARAEAALEIFEAIESPYAQKARNQLAEWRGEK